MSPYTEKHNFYEGVLNFSEFARNYDLRCYEPSTELAPFVEHYFISRRHPHYDRHYVGHDVLSQPVASLFFTPMKSFFQGPSTSKRTLIAKISPIYVGAQFKPGGFYPFYGRWVNELAERTIPASQLLPRVDDEFTANLLSLTDNQKLLRVIDSLLQAKRPVYNSYLEIVEKIILYIEEYCTTATVASVAEHFGMSERSLQHLFQKYVGVGAKWAIMRARFLEVIKYARTQEELDWVVVATEFGYTDQSHFINDFKKLVGQSPAQFTKTWI